jgi:hypothetical protein
MRDQILKATQSFSVVFVNCIAMELGNKPYSQARRSDGRRETGGTINDE